MSMFEALMTHLVIFCLDFDPYGGQKSTRMEVSENGGAPVVVVHALEPGYGWSGWAPLAPNSLCCRRQIFENHLFFFLEFGVA